MANGLLAAVSPAATTDTLLYQPGSGNTGTGVLYIANQNSGVVKVRVSLLASTGSPDNAHYLAYDLPLNPAGSNGCAQSISGIVLTNPNALYVRSDTANVSFVLSGIEGA